MSLVNNVPIEINQSKITYREALRQSLRSSLQKDERVFLMGEDVGRYGGAFAVSKGLLEEFGPERIIDTPLSEAAFTGAGIGAAIGGMRPIVEIMTVNFSLLALDQIINNAATLLHMSGGQINVPLVIRISCGIGRQLAAQHSHSWEPIFAHIPGLKIVAAGTHDDARIMLGEALKEKDPVIIFEYTAMLNNEGAVDIQPEEINLTKAKIRKSGTDISIIAYGSTVYKAMAAADQLSKEGINAEVVDLRILRPLDMETIAASISKTHLVLIVEDAWKSVSISSEIAARISEDYFFELDGPIRRVCGIEVPIPYPKHLEEASVPQVETIVEMAKKMVRHD